MSVQVAKKKGHSAKKTLHSMWEYRWIYLMLIPCIVYFVIFKYVPMYGIQLAFKDYVLKGVAASPWNDFAHFKYMMSEPQFLPALRNTLIISFYRILFGFPFPILLAIMINEVYMPRYKKVLQTIYTFPHFLTWVVMAGIMLNLLGSTVSDGKGCAASCRCIHSSNCFSFCAVCVWIIFSSILAASLIKGMVESIAHRAEHNV